MPIILDGTAGIANNATDLSYTGTLTGSTGVVNLGSGQVYKDASGNVGIGTSSPASKLSSNVSGAGSVTALNLTNDNSGFAAGTGSVINFGIANSGLGIFGKLEVLNQTATIGSNSYMAFSTRGGDVLAERARIDSSGNLLLNTSTLQSARVTILTTAGAAISCAQTTASDDQIYFRTSTSTLAGYITCPTATSTSYLSVSDYRLKENATPMTGALAKISALKPCTYTWKADGLAGQGFIAHELQAVIPDCVVGKKDAVDAEGKPQYQGIDTSFLVATLTAAIQEQQALIQAMTTRITALEAK